MVGRYIFPLSDEELQVFEKKINYSFVNKALLREALQAPGGSNGDGNRNLALIGVKTFDFAIIISDYRKNKTIGEISKIPQRRVSKANLVKQGFIHGIDRFIVKNRSQVYIMPSVMATTIEAIIGAVYLDCDQQIQPCADVMTALGLSWPE